MSEHQRTELSEFPLDVKDIRISDPFILADEESGLYYMYSAWVPEADPEITRRNVTFAYASRDLIHWTKAAAVFDGNDTGFWGKYDYWAPECHRWEGKYVLISSFRGEGTLRRCQCLVSDSPLGPFVPIEEKPVTPEGWQCLDGTLYRDDGGRPWMVFCHEWLQVGDGQIAAIPLSQDLGHAVGEAKILFRASDAPWAAAFYGKDQRGGWVTDGPFLYTMKDGSLLMLWSNFTVNGYAVGQAKSLSGRLSGPWRQLPDPLFFHDGGHAMLFHSFSGQLLMALHCPNTPHTEKRLLLFTMEENNGKLAIVNEITGNWYTGAKGPAEGWVYSQTYSDFRGLKD